jgi:alpha-amylase
MHKKMLRVSRKVHGAFAPWSTPVEILESLWAGQCNDPYWHGLFGGLYLPNLRFPLYRSLLKAEAAIDQAGRSKSFHVENTDFDCDGYDELIVESTLTEYCFKPDAGGCLVELSFKTGAVNLLDVLSRREEASHRKLFEALNSKREPGFTVDYLVSNLEESPIETHFGVEFALGGMAGDVPDRFLEIGVRPPPIVNSPLTTDDGRSNLQTADPRLRSQGIEADVESFKATDDWMHVASTWALSQPATLKNCRIGSHE